MTLNKKEKCLICNNYNHTVIQTEIREGKNDVLRCDKCNFIFLKKYKTIKYSEDYGSMTLDKSWNIKEQILSRAKSIEKTVNFISSICNKSKHKNILELGSGVGASIYALNNLLPKLQIDAVEKNLEHQIILKKEFSKSKIYNCIDDINSKYDFIFGIQVFEHFENPVEELKKLKRISHSKTHLFFLFPNEDDWYKKTLPIKSLKNYNQFMYHKAHPYYYTIDTFSKIISKTDFAIKEISTIQDYSISNYFNWYFKGEPNKNITDATKIHKDIKKLNDEFVKIAENESNGNNISALLKIDN
tara:strand:- start:804 stop:1706 length:903 start_codon:yes stop_codon:yes gene_type:complete